MVSVTSLDEELKRSLEPRAASAQARLRVIAQLAERGIPVGVMVAPVIPAITDHEMESILSAAAEAGASSASYVLLRLPHEVKTLFREWLADRYPDRAQHVMSLIRQARGGKDYDAAFGTRMRGTGPYAELLRARFKLAVRKFGLDGEHDRHELTTELFQPPIVNAADRGAQRDAGLREAPGSASPMPLMQSPTTTLVDPGVRDPVVARSSGLPTARHPDVAAVVPIPVAANPDIAGLRRGAVHFDLRCRRRCRNHADIDMRHLHADRAAHHTAAEQSRTGERHHQNGLNQS